MDGFAIVLQRVTQAGGASLVGEKAAELALAAGHTVNPDTAVGAAKQMLWCTTAQCGAELPLPLGLPVLPINAEAEA